jgi:hypothetical protein
MDRRTLYHYLAQTDDHIDQATERLERQSRIIERLKSAGCDTTADEVLLACFERTLEAIRSEHRSIAGLLNALKGRPQPIERLTFMGASMPW